MSDTAIYLTNIYRYDLKKQEWTLKRDYEIALNFKFSSNDFYIVKKSGYFFVTIAYKDNALYTLYYIKENRDGEKVLPSEVASDFRKKYLKNNITQQAIDRFIDSPTKYGVDH